MNGTLAHPHRAFFARILRLKFGLLLNSARTMERHLLVHLALFVGLVSFLTIGGTAMFFYMFRFLLAQDIIGEPLVDRLVSMILLVFFLMLVFSNLVITLSTTYISREINYYMSQPVSYRDVFLFKLAETMGYSSWAFVILSCPLFLGYGIAKGLPPTFYLGVAVLMVPFLLIPAALGAIATMLFAACIPARRSRAFTIFIGFLGFLGIVWLARMAGFNQLMRAEDFTDFKQLLRVLEIGRLEILPNMWMAEGTFAAGRGEWWTVLYWFAVLMSTGMFLMQVCIWLIEPLYYRGWALAKGASGRSIIDPRTSVFNRLDVLYGWFGRPWKALIGKDLRTFWRDPAQWSQLMILLSLLFFYVANIRQAAENRGVNIIQAQWQTLISFLNMGATCFILSILSTRFFYPMLSLEGRQYWSIGLAPIRRSTLLVEKYFFCIACALAITLPLMLFSNYVLEVPRLLWWRSLWTLIALSFGLTSLSVGLGAISPNFREDNPARIANGVGGTMNIVLSLIYISVILAIVSVPTYLELTGRPGWTGIVATYKPLLIAAFFAINALVTLIPFAIGVRAWNRMEF